MNKKQHCQRSKATFGINHHRVHQWLDELADAGDGYFDTNHRIHRHNLEGVAEIRRRWGDGAARAAEQHIMDDFGFIVSRAELIRRYGGQPQLERWSSLFEGK